MLTFKELIVLLLRNENISGTAGMALNCRPPCKFLGPPLVVEQMKTEEVSYFGYLKILYHHSGVEQIFEPSE